MAFNHRKLISASETLDINQCDELFFCSTKNPEGICPKTCFYRCPSICIHPITLFIPPPSPPLPPPTSSQYKILRLPLPLLVSLSFLVAICFLFFCYTLYKSYKNWVDLMDRRRRRRPPEVQQEETHDQFLDQDRGPVVDHPVWYIRTVGLQSSVINSIAICKYKRGDGLVEVTECSVCLNEFQEDEILRLLPKCNHAFHIPCIDTWLRSHTNCPLCRAGIVGNAVGIPTVLPGQSVDNPRVREEDQVVVSEIGGEFRREREDEELMGIEEGEREVENREKSLETPEEDAVHQPKRRSMSMDSVYASMTNAYQGEIGGSSGSQTRKTNESSVDIVPIVPDSVDANRSILKFVGGSSIERSPQKGPISMERSLSCSGKG
ncbi:RING-H2 finger protein ATL54-like [Rhododendron vialii]|uniref:RING-H2 finger protein ATL54-like n=1 Tax=Rhododendron vialii TaxID=182163 RepID=UPI00265E97DD|nr:RING-H2 finger protein ATL54-like [Rhododendron vialii]